MDQRIWIKPTVKMTVYSAFIYGSYLVFSIVVPASSEGDKGFDGPRLSLSSNSQDLGVIRPGIKLSAAFSVKNTGNRRLIISDQNRHCCGEPTYIDPVVIMPEESKLLVLEFMTPAFGSNTRHERIFWSNDPQLPQFVLSVTYWVYAEGSLFTYHSQRD